MSVLGRLLVSSAERLDLPDFLSIDSFAAGDWKYYMKSLVGTDRPYVLRGFDVIDPDLSIGTASISVRVADSIVYYPENTAGPFFHGLEEGNTLSQPLIPELKKSATNYVYLTLSTVDTAKDTRNFWDPDKEGGIGGEFAQDVNTESVLIATINVSVSSFPADTIPVCKVVMDSTSVVSIEDTRDLMFRLGTGGASADPFNNFPFRDLPSASYNRDEPSALMNNALDPNPFQGGDKNIYTLKEWMDAVMTNIKELKATPYWYTTGAWPGSMGTLRADATHSTITSSGSVTHSQATAGQMNWDADLQIRFLSGELGYEIASNAATTDVTLADNEVAYLNLVRGESVLPNLIFSNASTAVTSVGAVTWTTNLVAGDFIRLASLDDSAYVEIASVDSPTAVTLVNPYPGASTGIAGAPALYAYGKYQTDAAPSTDRHVQIANRLDVPLDENTFWLFFRDDNGGGTPKVFTRFRSGEVEQGETIEISDNTSAAVLSYMGSAGEADSDPDYVTLATGTKSAQANYNASNGENLTVRASKLTSMMADKAQDKTIKLSADFNTVTNTINAAAQDITFAGGTPQMDILMPSSADNGTIGLGGTLSLNANQSAVFTVDRNAAFSLADLTGLTVVDTDSVTLDENTFVFAYRLAGTDVYLWDGTRVQAGATVPSLTYLQLLIQQNKTAKLIEGGIWSWDLGTTTLTWDADAFVQVAGITKVSNEINVGSTTLTADGQVAYVRINRVSGAAILTVNTADIASVPNEDDIFIFARRVGDDAFIGLNSIRIRDGEQINLDDADYLVNDSRFKTVPASTPDKTVSIWPSKRTSNGRRIFSYILPNISSKFPRTGYSTGNYDGGANDDQLVTISFSDPAASVVTVTATGPTFGAQVLGTFTTDGANPFTPVGIFINPDDTLSIIAGSNYADQATASLDDNLPVGGETQFKTAIIVHEVDGGNTTTQVIAESDIIDRRAFGGAGGGSGSGSTVLGRLEDFHDEVFARFLEPNVFELDAEDKVNTGSSTGSYSIVTKTYDLDPAEVLVSYSLLDPVFLAELNDVLEVTAAVIYDSDNIDSAPAVEFTNNGDLGDAQTMTMTRLSTDSDTYVGNLVFDLDALTAQTLHEYAYANADATLVLNDGTTEQRSQEFDQSQVEVLETIGIQVDKTGTPTGFLKVNLHEDNAGDPGTITHQSLVNIASLTAGVNTLAIDIGRQVLPASGKFHISVSTDAEYKSTYVAATHEIGLRADSSAPTIADSRVYNGATWAAVAGSSLVHKLEGRALDLIMRITATDASKLDGYGVYYGEEAQSVQRVKRRAQFVFDGTVDNLNEFQLPWDADPDFLTVSDIFSGQTWQVPAFELQNNKVVFEVDYFDGRDTVHLIAKQVEAGSYDANPEVLKLAQENHLGSNDATIDRSVAGRGPIVRPDGVSSGTLVELTVDEDFNLVIKEA